MLLSNDRNNDLTLVKTSQGTTSSNNDTTLNPIELASKSWKDAWYTQFD